MPKIQNINPDEVRKAGFIRFSDIPVNQYKKTVKDEQKNFKKDELINIYRHMRIIREFENMLNAIKRESEYNGIKYTHPGPAHLSIGQEAAAVGQCYLLDIDDYIFGSHRSHGEILAKGLSAIEKLDEKKLMDIMKNYQGGLCLSVVEKGQKKDIKALAQDFLIYGTLAEIFGREAGFHKGLGGSMHAFFMPFGIYPNNAIVGGSVDIATGAALYKKINRKKGIVISNVGDAAMACGPVWEGMVFGSMDQYRKLWEGDMKGGLPIIYNFMNNQYGMGGQTRGETMGYDVLARVGAGLGPTQLHAERVDGYNPLAVIDAIRRKKEVLDKKDGPVLLDTLTYRYSGHSPSDASSYRSEEEMDAWRSQDPIIHYGQDLVSSKILSEEELKVIDKDVEDLITKHVKLTTDDAVSPRLNLDTNPDAIEKMMFSNGSVDKLDDREPEVNHPMEENPRVQQISKKYRYAYKDGKPTPKIRTYNVRDGIFEAVIDRFYKDPTLVAYGEENRDWGGAFAVYRGLTEALPYHRLFNSPIAEGAIVGTGCGYAMSGGRALVELMYCDFMGRAGDEIFNQICKWQAMSANEAKMPLVVRVSVGSKYGAQHSQDWTALVAHMPGIKVAFPSTPYDAKGLMNAALQGTDPVIFFESQRNYDFGEMFREEGVPEGYYEIPFGDPDVKRQGGDLTILTIGATLYRAVEAADILKEKYGVEAEIIDARSIVPFDYQKVVESVRKTGRIVLASDACERASVLKDMAQNISELVFDDLDAPPVVVGSKNWITPIYEMEDYFFPQASWIIDAVHEKILPLEGHTVSNHFTYGEKMRTSRGGV